MRLHHYILFLCCLIGTACAGPSEKTYEEAASGPGPTTTVLSEASDGHETDAAAKLDDGGAGDAERTEPKQSDDAGTPPDIGLGNDLEAGDDAQRALHYDSGTGTPTDSSKRHSDGDDDDDGDDDGDGDGDGDDDGDGDGNHELAALPAAVAGELRRMRQEGRDLQAATIHEIQQLCQAGAWAPDGTALTQAHWRAWEAAQLQRDAALEAHLERLERAVARAQNTLDWGCSNCRGLRAGVRRELKRAGNLIAYYYALRGYFW